MMLMLTVALADTQVQDDAGLFTADEIAEISAICDRIESAYQVDMFVPLTDAMKMPMTAKPAIAAMRISMPVSMFSGS